MNALQAKATARVDVPETSKNQGYGVELEETEKVKKSFPVFLRTLQGRHQVLSCICLLPISMSLWRIRVTCRARDSCWFTKAKLWKGLALWESGVLSGMRCLLLL